MTILGLRIGHGFRAVPSQNNSSPLPTFLPHLSSLSPLRLLSISQTHQYSATLQLCALAESIFLIITAIFLCLSHPEARILLEILLPTHSPLSLSRILRASQLSGTSATLPATILFVSLA